MSLAEYLRVLRRSWILIVAMTVVGGALGLVYAGMQPTLYRSYTSTMVVYRQGGSTTELLQGSSYVQNSVQTYALLAASPYVLGPVVEELGIDETPTALARRVAVETPLNTTILQIAVTDEDPARAAAIADAVTNSLTRAVGDLSPQVDDQPSVRLQTIAPATLPRSFISPDRRLYAGVGAIAGLAVAVAAAFLHDMLRSRPRSIADFARLDVPALGEIPRVPRRSNLPQAILDEPTGPVAEAVRAIAANLRFVSLDTAPQVLVVTSAQPGEGKSSTAIALGLTMAAANQRTLIVEADLRSPRIASLLGIEGAVGLTSLLVHEATLSDAVQQWGHENLRILTAGRDSPNPGQLVSSGQLSETITAARAMFDRVIIDTPPIEPVSDALWLAPSADGVILVARARKTPLRAVEQAVEAVATTRTPVLGVILTGVKRHQDSRYHNTPYGSLPTTPTSAAMGSSASARSRTVRR